MLSPLSALCSKAMEKKKITIKRAISDCRKMFKIPKSTLSKEADGHFLIDKRDFERGEVVSKLMNYFADKVIIDGQCAVEPITLLYTSFIIGPRQKQNQ